MHAKLGQKDNFEESCMLRRKDTNIGSLDELVQYVTLYVRIPMVFSGIVLPFIVLYLMAFYLWICQEYESGGIAVVVVAFLHVITLLCCYWSVHFQSFLNCRKVKIPNANALAKVVPTPNNGSSEMVNVNHIILANGQELYYFYFQKIKYIWDEHKARFRGVEFPINESLSYYAKSRGLKSNEAIKQAEQMYGTNQMEMVVPEFYELFIERATAPFFIFQVFSVGLWCLDEYWYYSLFTLFMLIAFECTLVQQQLRNMSEIRKMGNKPYLINVFRNSKWQFLKSDELLPGDIISITRSQDKKFVPCDLVLLRGSCIVDESLLTGESVPQMKESLESLDKLDRQLDMAAESRFLVLFGGTKVLQHTSPTKVSIRAPDGGCIGYVLQNGFNTSQGKLLRTILFGVKRVTENNWETFAFIMFLMVFAVAAASYVWIRGIEDPERNRYKLFLECTLILTSIIPPDLPIELTLAVNSSLMQLSKLFIFCTEPFRIPFAGKVQICCFDKTGTLTSDNLMVDGIAGLSENKDIISINDASDNTIQVLATCHSLSMLESGLVGDPLEKAMLSAIGWSLTKQDIVIPKKSKLKSLRIYQRYFFAPALKRMAVLAGYLQSFDSEANYIATVKGAPEVLMNMLEVIPENYEKTFLEYSRRGARVLALGIKEMGKLSHQNVRGLKREDIENNLQFAGFLIISCPIKPDTKLILKELIQSSHKVVMITGDNSLTACYVAKEIHFSRKELLILTAKSKNNDKWQWLSIDETVKFDFNTSINKILKHYELCITGECLQYLKDEHPNYLLKLLPYITVCARFAPQQKEFMITTLKQLGFCTLMCGDGTNDVGALKHANVGVSLLSNVANRSKNNSIENYAGSISTSNKSNATLSNRHNNQSNQRIQSALRNRSLQRRDQMIPAQSRLQTIIKESEDDVPVVKLGDASIAAPFTSKMSSIICVSHIIKQGRCTLVTTLQMFKILALNALISAYCQSVLYIDGVKFSDTQVTLQGVFIAVCFLCITRSKPLKSLSKTAPLPNIFNAYSISTIMGQFATHFSALYYLIQAASVYAEPKEGRIKLYIDMSSEEKQNFEPNIVNSTVYIICIALQVSTFAVNYKGHPFMENLCENRFLLCSILLPAALVVALAFGISTDLCNSFEIIDFPTDFRKKLIIVLISDTIVAYLVDRTCSLAFGENRRKPFIY